MGRATGVTMAFRTVDEFLALTGEERPTPAEVRLVEAVRAGTGCVISETRPEAATHENTVRASLLRLLITGATQGCGTQDFGVWLEGGWVTGRLDLSFAKARGRTVLDACHFVEEPRLPEADLNELSLEGSHLPGLYAQGMRLRGSLFLRKVTATGTVDVNGAKIGRQMDCEGARLDGAGGEALNAQGVETGAALFLRGVTATGTVAVNGAKIGGQMDCGGARLDGAGGEALNAQRLQVEQGLFWRDVTVTSGRVMLGSAQVGDLVDDGRWPEGTDMLILDGFTYDRIGGDKAPVTAAGRQAWLRAGSVWKGRFLPQPYTQLARVFRSMGHGGEARMVLYWREGLVAEQERRDILAAPVGAGGRVFGHLWRKVRAAFVGVGSRFLSFVAGYGYKPVRALRGLLGLWLLAWLLAYLVWVNGQFAPNSDVVLVSEDWQDLLARDCEKDPDLPLPAPCVANPAEAWSGDPLHGMDWESFSPWGYALDLVVPILDLGQTDAWAPSKDRGWWGWGLWFGRGWFAVLGWLVTALGAAAVTGIMQRDRE